LTFKIDRFDDYAKNLQEAKKWKSLLSMRHESPTFDLLKTGSNVIVIVNPFSGTGRAQNLFNEIASPIFNEADINFVTMQTEKRLHAKEMIKCLSLENIDAIIVCAGDGVLFEVIFQN
jgi:sphingosine kinase